MIYFFLINCLAFFAFGIDKYKAKNHLYRISEATLLFLGFIGGSIGGIAGMSYFRHKTKKAKFLFGYSFFLIFHLLFLFH